MKCENCGSEDLDIMLDITISIPQELYHNLHKQDFKRSDVKIYSANWSSADFICKKCGYVKSAELDAYRSKIKGD